MGRHKKKRTTDNKGKQYKLTGTSCKICERGFNAENKLGMHLRFNHLIDLLGSSELNNSIVSHLEKSKIIIPNILLELQYIERTTLNHFQHLYETNSTNPKDYYNKVKDKPNIYIRSFLKSCESEFLEYYSKYPYTADIFLFLQFYHNKPKYISAIHPQFLESIEKFMRYIRIHNRDPQLSVFSDYVLNNVLNPPQRKTKNYYRRTTSYAMIIAKQYYDTYIKTDPMEGKCVVCGEPTNFYGLGEKKNYAVTCSIDCHKLSANYREAFKSRYRPESKKRNRWQCPYCRERFSLKKELISHLKLIHEDEIKKLSPKQCRICGEETEIKEIKVYLDRPPEFYFYEVCNKHLYYEEFIEKDPLVKQFEDFISMK